MTDEELVPLTLVPVEVYGTVNGYGLCDAVQAWSDCNRAVGHIFRVDEEHNEPYRLPGSTIKVYVPRSELHKLLEVTWGGEGDCELD